MGLANLVVIGYFATWLARHIDNVSLAPRWFTLAPAVLKPVLGVGVSTLLQSGFLSMAQGILFIPLVLLGNLWIGLAGIIWALTVTEAIVFLAGVAMWLASRRAIGRGLAEGSPERAEEALDQAEA